MADHQAMADEIERLRDLLCEHGIDPEPYIAPPVKFGPPTYAEFALRKMADNAFGGLAKGFAESPFSAPADTIGRTLRIRLPVDYVVARNFP